MWNDIERLALYWPEAQHAVTLVRRGDWSHEQALIALVYTLAEGYYLLFSAEVDRRSRMSLID